MWNRARRVSNVVLAIWLSLALALPAHADSFGATPGPVPPLGPQLWMLAGSGENLPENPFTPASYQAYEVSKHVIYTPNETVTNCRVGYAAWYISVTAPYENLFAAPVTIRGAKMQIGSAAGSYPFSFGTGASVGGTVPNTAGAAYLWSNPNGMTLGPNTRVEVWTNTSWTVGLANSIAGTFTMHPANGELVNFSATPIDGVYAGTTKPGTNYTAVTQGYGPSAFACQGSNGNPVVYLMADSLGTASGETYTTGDVLGNSGLIPRLLDGANSTGTPSGVRYAWAKASVPGSANSEINTVGTIANLGAFMNNVPGNNGLPPFSVLFNEMGTNDSGTNTQTVWQNIISTSIGVYRSVFPGVRVLQSGWPPRQICSNTYYCSAGDTPTAGGTDFPAVSIAVQNTIATGGLTNNPDAFFAIDYLYSNSRGAGTVGTWCLTCYQGALSWTLAGNVNIGGATLTITATTSNPLPLPGSGIVIDPNTANAEEMGVVSILQNVGPTYTLTLETYANAAWSFVHAHTAGATIAGTNTLEGIHPGSYADQQVAAAMAAAFNTGSTALFQ